MKYMKILVRHAHMHGTRDGVSFWVRTDGTYTTESWTWNPNKGSWGRFFWSFFKLSEMRMRQVIKHRNIRLLKMNRRTDPVIPRASNWNSSSIKTWKRWNYEPWLASTSSANSVRAILTSIVLRPVNATKCCCNAVLVSWSFLTYKTSPRSWTSIQILSAKFGVTLRLATDNSLKTDRNSQPKLRHSPSASDFQSLPRAISCRFCNFAARTDSRRRLQHEMNAPNAIFPRKRRIYNIR